MKHVYDDGVGEVSTIEGFHIEIKMVKNISIKIIILGDINIGMLEYRDQISISRTCRTMPI